MANCIENTISINDENGHISINDENGHISINDENGHIESVNFNSYVLNGKCIKGMNEWKNLSKFSIITGLNGTAKTTLLDYINEFVNLNRNQFKTKLYFQNQSKLDSINLNSILKPSITSKIGLANIELLKNQSLKYLGDGKKETFHNHLLTNESSNDYFYQLNKINLSDANYKDRVEELVARALKADDSNSYRSENKFSKILEAYCINENFKIYLRECLFDCLEPHDQIKNFHDYYILKNGDNSDDKSYIEILKDKNSSHFKDYIESKLKFNMSIFEDIKKVGFEFVPSNDSESFDKLFKIKKLNIYSKEYETIDSFSSGEAFILNALAMKYNYDELELKKPNILLLDEPDSGFDVDNLSLFIKILYEDLCKGGNIQIIMITHNPNTIDLASTFNSSDIKFYTMKRKGNEGRLQIEQCTPLIAKFRLTNSEFCSIKLRVYVEASNDVMFYNYYYSVLYQLCNETRKKSKTQRYLDQQNEKYRLLSRRYQPEFFSVDRKEKNKTKSGGGGCILVRHSIERDINFYDKMKSINKSEIDPKVRKPFGIIDLDYGNPLVEGRIVKLERYSIENFMFDPYCLFSKQTNFDHFPDSDFKPIVKESISKNSSPNDFESDTFNKYFKAMLARLLNDNQNRCDIYYLLERKYKKTAKKREVEEFKNFDKLDQLLKDKYLNLLPANEIKSADEKRVEHLLAIREPVEYMFVKDKDGFEVKTIEYPYLFLYLRGHSIEDSASALLMNIAGKKSEPGKKELETFFENFYNDYQQHSVIPIDLAQKFFELSSMARKQANDIYKPVSFLASQFSSGL